METKIVAKMNPEIKATYPVSTVSCMPS